MFKYLTQQCNLVTQGPSPEQDHCSSQTLEKLSNISVIPTVGMKALFWKPLWHKVPRNPKSQNLNNFASIALQVLGQDQSLPSSSFAKISTLTFLQKQKRIPFFFFFAGEGTLIGSASSLSHKAMQPCQSQACVKKKIRIFNLNFDLWLLQEFKILHHFAWTEPPYDLIKNPNDISSHCLSILF